MTEPLAGPAIHAAGVTVKIGDRTILDDVSLDIAAGEMVALVGPNGAGKSTLLAVLAGDRTPTSGSVVLGGIDPHRASPKTTARRRAVLLQDQQVAFPFRAREVVRMGRSPWRGTRAERDDERVVDAAMRVADLESLAEQPFGTMSGGERARTGFARTLAHGTGIQFLDEPTAALDIHHQERVLHQARRGVRRGMTSVVVLHDLALAAAYADRIAVMAAGRLRAFGRPREVLTPQLLSEIYQHPVDVIEHPTTGAILIAPLRYSAEEWQE
ncbi:heme ABC transporter ATP-binding protein [Rarobacter incanus]|uniref:Iron complex transport system ATP-binding protein n=1 Tax=Rarobacter incanus TaxID=153494 RepID=A0A542SRE3_9MICO|nr:heme ABC transporter ATP-binding protein [Rarobacter incanus]TQK77182.1 iron complex transport system ATP-binding protein [Rarobacter incanus]